jgi:predicted anti-sigma-YlaC factor YlaD
MSCEPVRGLLSAYLDDQLLTSERQSVSAHLRICTECCAILADYRRFDALLAQLPYITPPPTLRTNIFSNPNFHHIQNSKDSY